MIFKKIIHYIVFPFSFCSCVTLSYASVCDLKTCDGLSIPLEAQKVIADGYENITIENYLGNKYLVATTASEINKCSVLFAINGNSIDTKPIAGVNNQICNTSIHDNKVVSSWRDAGKWNDDVYQINADGTWKLLFNDSCIGCDQIKRTYYLNDKMDDTSLLSDGDDFTKRKELTGQVTADKATLFKIADINYKTKSYLIKGDKITLSDMSKDGEFYKIKYRTNTGKYIVLWMKSEDFILQ